MKKFLTTIIASLSLVACATQSTTSLTLYAHRGCWSKNESGEFIVPENSLPAVEMAKKVGEGVRVNAIAPGFFITEQNRTLMTNPDGSLSDRAKDVVRATPFGRLGEADELHGAVVFYSSDASKFITGTVLPVDGGFSIFSGV